MEATLHPLLAALVQELEDHPVNTNIFFKRFKDQGPSRLQLQNFFRQYQYFCKHFVKLLEGLLYKTPVDQVGMRIELAKTIYSELGNGNPAQAHITLLNNFARALGLDEPALNQTVPLPTVRSYLTTLHHLFMESDYLTALGAEMAVEITAASEFQYLYPGLKQYGCFSEEDLTFFRLHIEEESWHGSWLMEAVQHTAGDEQDYDKVTAGARKTADAWHEFWLGLYREIFDANQGDRVSLPVTPPGTPTPRGQES